MTQLKTILSFAISFLLACIMLLPMQGGPSVMAQDQSKSGTTLAESAREVDVWYGELDVKVAVLRLEFHVEKADDGKLSGHMISLDQGRAKLKFDRVEINDKTLSLAIKQAQLEYTGELDDAGKIVKGTFKQIGNQYPLNLELVEVDPDRKHTQTWAGRMTAGTRKFDFQFRFFEKDGEEPQLRLDSFTENDFDRRATMVHDYNGITIEIPSTKAKITGKMNEAFDRLDAQWQQRDSKFDLVLRKMDLGQTRDPKVKRPQTPKLSFKYKTTEHRIDNEADKVTIAGSLTVPNGKGPFPVVVTISGSGPQDRDETIYNHKPFFVIADHLAKNKIATFRYDERGVGESTGNFAISTSKDFARDVEAIVEYLKTKESLDSSRIVLVGHSEGGYIAPMVAARRNDISGVVMLAGPGVPGSDIIRSQRRLISEADGEEPKTIESMEFLFEALESGGKTTEELAKLVNEKFKNEMTAEEKEMTPVMIEQLKAQFSSPWFKFFLKHDPRVDLRKLKVPVLALFGEKDLQVDPKLNVPAIKVALKAAGNTNVVTKVLPKLNHLFQECETGSPSEYPAIEQTFAPAALDVLTNWLKGHFKMK